MMEILILLGMVAGICVFFSSVFQRKAEVCLPLAVCTMIIVLYVFALAGKLALGAWAVIVLAIGLAAAGLVLAAVRKQMRSLLRLLLTPGMLIYVVFWFAVCVINAGKPVHTWDEFTHWADAVKVMTTMNVLHSDPAAHSLFASYPPAISLWQYLPQRIACLLAGETVFSEDLLFMAYQWFMLALFMPFLNRLRFRRPLELMVCAAAAPLCIVAVFTKGFDMVYADTLIGAMGGFVCAYAFFHKEMDLFDKLMMCASLFVLTLCKDAAVVWALAGAAAAGILSGPGRQRWMCAAVLAAAVLLARGSWSVYVQVVGAAAQETFDNPVSLSVLLDPAQHWRITTLRNFIYEFFALIFPVQGTTVSISYFLVFVILGAGFAALGRGLQRAGDQKRLYRLAAVVFAAAAVYIIGMGVTYVFKFYEDEAVRLASYERYLNIAVLFAAFVLLCCFVQMRLPEWEGGLSRRASLLALAAFLLFVPFGSLLNAFSRLDVEAALIYQQPYMAMAKRVETLCETGDEKVYVVAADSGPIEQVILRYRLRPLQINQTAWNIFVDGGVEDRFTHRRSAEEWQRCLMEEYDYVVLYKTTETFKKEYGSVFAEPQKMDHQQVYRVDRELGKLVLMP